MMSPLHTKANDTTYRPTLTERERRTTQWWAVALLRLGSRTVNPRSGRPDVVVFTDAATSTAIIAAVTIGRDLSKRSETIREVRQAVAGKHWEVLFDATNLIYGLGMLALVALLYRPNNLREGKMRPSTLTMPTHSWPW